MGAREAAGTGGRQLWLYKGSVKDPCNGTVPYIDCGSTGTDLPPGFTACSETHTNTWKNGAL